MHVHQYRRVRRDDQDQWAYALVVIVAWTSVLLAVLLL